MTNPHSYSSRLWSIILLPPLYAIAAVVEWWRGRRVPIFTVDDTFNVAGVGKVYVGTNPFGEVERSYPIGKVVRVNGRLRKIKAYEYFAISKIRPNDKIGFLFEKTEDEE